MSSISGGVLEISSGPSAKNTLSASTRQQEEHLLYNNSEHSYWARERGRTAESALRVANMASFESDVQTGAPLEDFENNNNNNNFEDGPAGGPAGWSSKKDVDKSQQFHLDPEFYTNKKNWSNAGGSNAITGLGKQDAIESIGLATPTNDRGKGTPSTAATGTTSSGGTSPYDGGHSPGPDVEASPVHFAPHSRTKDSDLEVSMRSTKSTACTVSGTSLSARKQQGSPRKLLRQSSRETGHSELLLTEFPTPWPSFDRSAPRSPSGSILRSTSKAGSSTPETGGIRGPRYMLSEYKTKLDSLLREYFLGGDFQAFVEQVHALRCDPFNDILVATVFRLGLDQRWSERVHGRDDHRMVNARSGEVPPQHSLSWQNLLKALLAEQVISQIELMRGLYGYACGMRDLQLDVPHAPQQLLNFFASLASINEDYANKLDFDEDSAASMGSLDARTGGQQKREVEPSKARSISATSPSSNEKSSCGGAEEQDLSNKLLPASILYRLPEDILRGEIEDGVLVLRATSLHFSESPVGGGGGQTQSSTTTPSRADDSAAYLDDDNRSATSSAMMFQQGMGGDELLRQHMLDAEQHVLEQQNELLRQHMPGDAEVPHVLDEQQDNFDVYNEDYTDIADEIRSYKRIIQRVLRDFFVSKDTERVRSTLMDLSAKNGQHTLLAHEFVKRAVVSSLDFGTSEQRQVVHLLKSLMGPTQGKSGPASTSGNHTPLLRSEDVQHGTAMVLGRLQDILVDVPHAKKILVEILTAFVTEEIISADLLKKKQQLEYGGFQGVEVLREVLHRTPEYSRRIWCSGLDDRGLLNEMDLAIREFFDSYDAEEVDRILTELRLSREMLLKFIKKIILYSIEKRDVHCGLHLVSYLYGRQWWFQNDVEDAVESIRLETDDLLPDIPDLGEATSYVVDQASRYGLVSENYLRQDQQYLV
ncbi:unnamed protein product [Amoebophrya sp. A25]|nr:unnamed protein product [Amoebophrya sp. A25]|eukprot:GSA25T00019282001.1